MSHREILQKRASEAERIYLDAAHESERIHSQVSAERQAIDDLNRQYETACRDLATGASADPAKTLAERDRRSHRLRGLEALEMEANGAVMRTNEEHAAASLALQEELDREELERLGNVILDAQKKRDAAQSDLNKADVALRAAVWARDNFRKKLQHQL